MGDQLAKYELHICNDIWFINNSIVKMPPFYHTNRALKRNSRNLKTDNWSQTKQKLHKIQKISQAKQNFFAVGKSSYSWTVF